MDMKKKLEIQSWEFEQELELKYLDTQKPLSF